MSDRSIRWSWVLYDVGSSGYALLIMAVAFPLYFRNEITDNAAWSDWLWGSLFALGSILAGLLVPVIGAAADISQRGWTYLCVCTGLSVIATMSLAIPDLGVVAASLLFVISLAAYHVAAALYDSLLRLVAQSAHALASGLGWGLGYLGGLACYAAALSSASLTSGNASISSPLPILVTGLYYGAVCGAALYGLASLRLAGRRAGAGKPWRRAIVSAMSRLRAGWKPDQSTRAVIASGLITGAAVSIGIFTPLLFASYFGLSAWEVGRLGVVFAIVSVPSTIAAGFLARRFGSRRMLFWFLPLWAVLAGLLISGTGALVAFAAVVLLGLTLGPTQAVGRSLVAAIAERDEVFVTFGFAALVNRLAGALGPLFFGTLSSASQGRTLPLLMAASLMVAGYVLLVVATAQGSKFVPSGAG